MERCCCCVDGEAPRDVNQNDKLLQRLFNAAYSHPPPPATPRDDGASWLLHCQFMGYHHFFFIFFLHLEIDSYFLLLKKEAICLFIFFTFFFLGGGGSIRNWLFALVKIAREASSVRERECADINTRVISTRIRLALITRGIYIGCAGRNEISPNARARGQK